VTINSKLRRYIFDRDGWICQLCLEPIRPRAPGESRIYPEFPTLDHIIPASCGGDNSQWNLQAAHATCNVDKGTTANIAHLLRIIQLPVSKENYNPQYILSNSHRVRQWWQSYRTYEGRIWKIAPGLPNMTLEEVIKWREEKLCLV